MNPISNRERAVEMTNEEMEEKNENDYYKYGEPSEPEE